MTETKIRKGDTVTFLERTPGPGRVRRQRLTGVVAGVRPVLKIRVVAPFGETYLTERYASQCEVV